MLGPNSLSHYIFYLFRLIALGIVLLSLFMGISFLTGNFEVVNHRYSIPIPLFGTQLTGYYKANVIITVVILLCFSSIFFFLLSNILKALKEKGIFNKKAIINLKLFTILNLIIGPSLYLLIHFPIMQKTNFGDIHNLILHLIVSMISFFVLYIFKKGYSVQSENDLTI